MGFLQTTFCIFNGLVALLAAVCVGVGAWALADKTFVDTVLKVLPENAEGPIGSIDKAAILIIIVGAVIMLIAGIGCCGAWKESKCLIGVFFISMLIISIVIIAAVVLVYIYPEKVEGELKKGLTEKFAKFVMNETATPDLKDSIDTMQRELKCCGANGTTDYTSKGKPVPASCGAATRGCVEAVIEDLKNLGSPISIAAIVTLVLMLLATAISGYLYCTGGEAV